jgi:hypothetical protein
MRINGLLGHAGLRRYVIDAGPVEPVAGKQVHRRCHDFAVFLLAAGASAALYTGRRIHFTLSSQNYY